MTCLSLCVTGGDLQHEQCCVCIEPLVRPGAPVIRLADWQLEDTGARCAGVELFRCAHALHTGCAERALAVRDACPMCRLEAPRIAATTIGVATSATAAAAADRFTNRTNQEYSVHRTTHYWEQWSQTVVFFYEDVVDDRDAEAAEQVWQARLTRERAKEQTSDKSSTTDSSSSFRFGGGSSEGGQGTTDSW